MRLQSYRSVRQERWKNVGHLLRQANLDGVSNFEVSLWLAHQSLISQSFPGWERHQVRFNLKTSLRDSNRSIDLDQSDVTDTYFDNQPVVHESPFNLQPIMVLGCKGKGSGSFIRPPKGICLTPQGGIWAVDKGRVVVYDKDYHSLEPIRINAAAKPACLTATHEGQIAMVGSHSQRKLESQLDKICFGTRFRSWQYWLNCSQIYQS